MLRSTTFSRKAEQKIPGETKQLKAEKQSRRSQKRQNN
jgi:hypothetical protein